MATKSSQNRTQNRVPKKWRDLPPAGHGITPAMKARPIIQREPLYDDNTRHAEDECNLMPVPFPVFMDEHAEILLKGYHTYAQGKLYVPCPNCAHPEQTFMHYAKRHRNGRPNLDWMREFNLCPECLYVTEEVYIVRDELLADTDPDQENVTKPAA